VGRRHLWTSGLAIVILGATCGGLVAARASLAASTRDASAQKALPSNLCDVKTVNEALSAFPHWRDAECTSKADDTRWTVGKSLYAIVDISRSRKAVLDTMGSFQSDSNPATISLNKHVEWAAGYWDDQYGQGEMGIEINSELYIEIQMQDPYLALSGINFNTTGETPAPQLIGVGESIAALT
jgi:hypothetical protein